MRRHGRCLPCTTSFAWLAAWVAMALGAFCSSASAYTFVLTGDQAAVVAAPGEINALEVQDLGGGLLVSDLAANPVTSTLPAGCAVGLGFEVICQPGVVAGVSVDAGDGNDSLGNGSVLTRATLVGGAGSDQISGGPAAETLSGGDGSDTIQGGAGGDIVDGGDGTDQIVGGDGDDALSGGPGDDRLDASDGNDRSDGGAGADTLTGGDGTDALSGDTGNDQLSGDDGVDSLLGGDGDDLLDGGRGADRLEGGGGADDVDGSEDADALLGGDGPDRLDGGDGSDDLTGDAGADTLDGGDGDDRLDGGADADALDGGSGNDAATGADGDDTIVGGEGADDLAGGAGFDLVSYAAQTAALTISIDGAADDGADGEHDVVRPGVEHVQGGAGPDRIIGSPAAERLDGGAGDDVLDGGTGPDTLIGADGIDTVTYASRTAAVTATIGAGGAGQAGEGDVVDASIEHLTGGSGPDRLTGALGESNNLVGGPGDDLLVIARDGGETDQAFCGTGKDRVSKDRRDIAALDCERVRTDGRLVRPSAGPKVIVGARRLRPDASGQAGLNVRCAAATEGVCIGTLTLTRRRDGRGPSLGTGRFRIAPRAAASVPLRLTAAGVRRRKQVGRRELVVWARIRLRDSAGRQSVRSLRLTLLSGTRT